MVNCLSNLSEVEFIIACYSNFHLLRGGRTVGEKNQNEAIFTQLKQMLEDMKYGSITLVVQDGKVIQLEKVEKVRLK